MVCSSITFHVTVIAGLFEIPGIHIANGMILGLTDFADQEASTIITTILIMVGEPTLTIATTVVADLAVVLVTDLVEAAIMPVLQLGIVDSTVVQLQQQMFLTPITDQATLAQEMLQERAPSLLP